MEILNILGRELAFIRRLWEGHVGAVVNRPVSPESSVDVPEWSSVAADAASKSDRISSRDRNEGKSLPASVDAMNSLRRIPRTAR